MKQTQQHIIPKFILKNFANKQGHLFVLDKLNGRVSRTSHKNACKKTNYYNDSLGADIDSEFFSRLECNFARILDRGLSSQADANIVWTFTAAMIWRTKLAETLACILHNRSLDSENPCDNLIINTFRATTIEWSRHWMGSKWAVTLLENPQGGFITSDQSAFPLHLDFDEDPVFFFPATPYKCFVIAPQDLPRQQIEELTTLDINAMIAGWAHTDIFSSDPDVLAGVSSLLQNSQVLVNPLWAVFARKSNFGISDWWPLASSLPPTWLSEQAEPDQLDCIIEKSLEYKLAAAKLIQSRRQFSMRYQCKHAEWQVAQQIV